MSIAEGKKPGYFYTRLLLTFTFTDVSNENCCLDRPQKTSNKKERSFTAKGKKKSNNKKRNTKKIKVEILFVLDSILLLSQETPKTMLDENVHKIYIF
jgi:hypothetical protein